MNILKKILAVVLACILVFGLAACGEAKVERNSDGNPHLTVPAKASKAGKYPAWVEVGKLSRAYITYEYDGQSVDRYFYYYLPSNYDPNDPPALMMTLHGSGVNADWQLREGNFVKIAEREGFAVLAPESTGVSKDRKLYGDGRGLTVLGQSDINALRWVAGDFEMAKGLGVDDVAYLSDLIDLFVAGNLIDGGRVYISGLSHGDRKSVV